MDRLVGAFPDLSGRVLDLGCGPADIPVRLCTGRPGLTVCAVDASGPMLELGRAAVAGAGLAERVQLLEGRIPGLPLEPGSFGAVVSNSLLHHLPDPSVLWAETRRLGAPGAAVFVCDLFRPESEEAARAIVAATDVSDSPVLEHDFFHSLLAAFRPGEVQAQLVEAGLELKVDVISDRHLLVWGRLPLLSHRGGRRRG